MSEPAMTDDALLTALIDGELPDADVAALRARLAREPGLLGRLELLRSSQLPFAAAFEPLLAQAPLDRLRAGLHMPAPEAREARWPRRAMFGALCASLFALGVLAGRMAFQGKPDTWRTAVDNYMELYADAPFPNLPPEALARGLADLKQKIGRPLDAGTLAVEGLAPRFAAALSYHGAPLAEVGYQEGDVAIAICIIKNGEADKPPKASREGRLNRVSWAEGGRGYLAIGAASPERIMAFALAARERLTPPGGPSGL